MVSAHMIRKTHGLIPMDWQGWSSTRQLCNNCTFVSGQTLPAAVILIVMFVIPLLVIFFKEPLTHAVEKKAEIMPKEKECFSYRVSLNYLKYYLVIFPTPYPSSVSELSLSATLP